MRSRLALRYGPDKEGVQLPFPGWTAGQRELAPLLLGLYSLLPASKLSKKPGIEWVVIEEPEMGLHPKAISAFLLLVLEMVARGYRVVLSTHSPDVVSAVWMLKRLGEKKKDDHWRLVAKAFGVTNKSAIQEVAEKALQADYLVHALFFRDGRAVSQDISSLDPWSKDAVESGWGGLTDFATRYGEAVLEASE